MVRKMMFCFAMSASLLHAAPAAPLPRELQAKIDELQLRDLKIAYDEKRPCVVVSGESKYRQMVAYVGMKYIGSGSTFHWTPLVAVPLYTATDSLWVEYIDNHILLLQWNSNIGRASVSGHYVLFDRNRAMIILRRISIIELIKLIDERTIAIDESVDLTPNLQGE